MTSSSLAIALLVTLSFTEVRSSQVSSERDFASCAANGSAATQVEACSRLLSLATLSPVNRKRALTYRAHAARALGQTDQALRDLTAAIELDGDFSAARFERSILLGGLGQNSEAIADLDAVLAREPKSALALHNRGVLFKKIGLPNRALADFDSALAQDASNPEYWSSRGIALQALERHQEAIADFSRSLRLRPRRTKPLNSRAVSHRALGNIDAAINDLDTINAISPSPAALTNRGACWRSKGEYGFALSDFDAAIQMDPAYSNAYFNRGILAFWRGDLLAANADFRRAHHLRADGYAWLWASITSVRKAGEGGAKLPPPILNAWPKPLIDFWMGSITFEDLTKAAAVGDETGKRGRICEARFFASMRNSGALRSEFLKAVANDCPLDYVEFETATLFLRAPGQVK